MKLSISQYKQFFGNEVGEIMNYLNNNPKEKEQILLRIKMKRACKRVNKLEKSLKRLGRVA